jgi:putative oxidoreductase
MNMYTLSRNRRDDAQRIAPSADGVTSRDPTTAWGILTEELIRTRDGAGPAVLRLAVAAVLFPHGAQHLLGWFGGYGFSGTYQWMTGLGFPGPMAALAIVTEFVAPFALLVGFASRVAAAGVVGLMLGALSVHLGNGFFMNWFGSLPAGAEGYEYHILVIAMAVAVLIEGAGRWSVDGAVTRRLDTGW